MSYGLWQHGIGAGHGQLDMFSEQEVNKKLMLERFQELRDGVAIQSSQMSKPPIDGKRRLNRKKHGSTIVQPCSTVTKHVPVLYLYSCYRPK
jgi:hypothetical protein